MATDSSSLELSDIRSQLSAHSSNYDEQFKLLALVFNTLIVAMVGTNFGIVLGIL